MPPQITEKTKADI